MNRIYWTLEKDSKVPYVTKIGGGAYMYMCIVGLRGAEAIWLSLN